MTLRFILTIFLLALLTTGQAQFQQPNPGLIYDNAEQLPQHSWGMDFTKGYAMVTGGNQNLTNVDSRTGMRLTTKYARKGNSSYELFVSKRTDYPGCCEWTRSEVMWMAPGQQTWGNEWNWSAVSIMIPTTWQFETRRVMIGYDHKESPDDMQTPFGLLVTGNRYVISGRVVPGGPIDLGPVEKGVWVDWLLERNWSTGSDGYLRFYKNGSLVWSARGPNRDGRGGSAPICRIQHGLYKWVWASSSGQGEGNGSALAGEPSGAPDARISIFMDEIKFGMKGNNLTLADFVLDGSTPPPVVVPPPIVVPPILGAISIVAGSSTDKYFSGGSTYSSNGQTERYGSFSYNFHLENGSYDVKLNFAEIYHTSANQRLFNVNIEGALKLSNYDIFQKAGSANKLVIEAFKINVSDGTLNIGFITVKDNAKISSIQISPAIIEPPIIPDLTVYVKSVVQGSKTITVNGVTKTIIVVTITYTDNSVEIIEKKL